MTILETEILSADDVLCVPTYGRLEHRSDAQLRPFIFSAPMDTVTGYELARAMLAQGQLAVVCRYLSDDEYLACLRDFHRNPNCYFAVGNLESCKGFIEKLSQLEHEGHLKDDGELAINVAVDIAHGDSIVAEKVVRFLREQPFIGRIMSGSICTAGAARRNLEWGATDLRVGVGPGAACTTRLQTGIGVPQLTAVYQVAQAVAYQSAVQTRVIADGGIRYPGDAVKYLVAGATHIMLGRRLAQTEESAGWEAKPMFRRMPGSSLIEMVSDTNKKVKRFRGQASNEFQCDFFGKPAKCAEGASSGELEPTGTVADVVAEFQGGVSSAISYLGLTSIDELSPQTVQLIKVSPAAYKEGTAHGV